MLIFFKEIGKNFKLQFTNIFARPFYFLFVTICIFSQGYIGFRGNHDPTKSKGISGECCIDKQLNITKRRCIKMEHRVFENSINYHLICLLIHTYTCNTKKVVKNKTVEELRFYMCTF